MYTQIFLVTSVRGMDFPPQIAASAGLRVFGAKMPTPFFFMANAFFLPAAARDFLPAAFFSAVIFFNVAFVGFVFRSRGRRRHLARRGVKYARAP